MDQRLKKIALFSLPVSANSLINILGNIIGVIFIAQLGIREIAAVNISASLYITLLTITSTTTYATSILTGMEAAKAAKGQPASVDGVFQAVNFGILLFSVPVAFILWYGSSLLELAGLSPSLTQLSQSYFHYAALAIFPINLSMVNSQFCVGLGKPNVSFYFSLIRLALITILSYGLILGRLGFPSLGIAGITAATFYVQVFVCLLMYAYFMLALPFKKFNLFKAFYRINFSTLRQFYKLGLPIGVQFGGELAAIFVNTLMIGYFGVQALAASQVATQYGLLLIMIFLGISQTLAVFTGIHKTNNQHQAIKKDCLEAIKLHSIIFLGFGLLFILAYKPLISLYINIHSIEAYDLLKLTLMLLAIRWVTLYLDGLRNLFSGVLRGLGRSTYPMKIGLYCLWLISIPFSYLTGFILNGGVIGLCIGFISGFAVATLLLWNRLNAILGVEFIKQDNPSPKKIQ